MYIRVVPRVHFALSVAEDAFNLYGLRDEIGSCFKECLEIILGPAPGTCGDAAMLAYSVRVIRCVQRIRLSTARLLCMRC
jgi:hypothetical protein